MSTDSQKTPKCYTTVSVDLGTKKEEKILTFHVKCLNVGVVNFLWIS